MDPKYLILVIGTNPLPNYVVGKYYLSQNTEAEVFLLYSEKNNYSDGTSIYAENLKLILESEFPNAKWNLAGLSDPEDRRSIESSVNLNIVEKLKNIGKPINLNYTGGTKAMAVHIYRTIEKGLSHCAGLSFSYLSARDFSIKEDNGKTFSGDLRTSIDIDFKTLVKLHGYEIIGDSASNPDDLPKTLAFLSDMIEQNLISDFLCWVKSFICNSFFDDENKFIENVNNFKKRNKKPDYERAFNEELVKHPWLSDFLKTFPKELSLLNEDGSWWYPEDSETNTSFKNRIKPLVKEFLHGKWFEKHVENCLTDLIKSKKLQLASNVKIIKNTGGKDFELDLVLINGYQTTVISCTTSSETHLCKSKGFEVQHRAAEFGGEESKAVLICGKKIDVDDLQDDLNQISNIGNRKLLILGLEDWKKENLVSKIEDFIF